MNIALIGYGVENASAYRHLAQKHPDATFTVYDESAQPGVDLPDGVAFVGSLATFKDVSADLLVRSPGIPPARLPENATVTTATKLFFDACPLPIIGVTGSKGKGTTCSLIAAILRAGGKTVWLVGNIGAPALDILPTIGKDEIVVYELSSFQLWDLKKSPQTAVVLMIEPEHLDVHLRIDDYIDAKGNIARYQHDDDRLIYHAGNEYSEQIARLSPGLLTAYPDTHSARVDGAMFYYDNEVIASVDVLQLPGEHNVENALAAIDAAWPWVKNPEKIAEGLNSFEGLPHRLKYVAQVEGVGYYDDSIATTPGSAIAAIEAFVEPKVLILGGSFKGARFEELARSVAANEIRHAIIIGDEAPRVESALKAVGYTTYKNLGSDVTMETVVQTAASVAKTGDVVILSPACASFGMFKNYADRGDQFIHAVNRLAG